MTRVGDDYVWEEQGTFEVIELRSEEGRLHLDLKKTDVSNTRHYVKFLRRQERKFIIVS
jgi:hypothetical protein